MTKVYLALSGAPDRLLGHVEDDGRVYRSLVGPDNLIGHVDLATGNIYAQRFGPDKKVGHVDLSSGRVYATHPGPDAHVGQVREDGMMYLHQALATDDYVGHVDSFRSHAHTAGAMLLLVMPALETEAAKPAPEEEENTE